MCTARQRTPARTRVIIVVFAASLWMPDTRTRSYLEGPRGGGAWVRAVSHCWRNRASGSLGVVRRGKARVVDGGRRDCPAPRAEPASRVDSGGFSSGTIETLLRWDVRFGVGGTGG
jgi:hypothetical protein